MRPYGRRIGALSREGAERLGFRYDPAYAQDPRSPPPNAGKPYAGTSNHWPVSRRVSQPCSSRSSDSQIWARGPGAGTVCRAAPWGGTGELMDRGHALRLPGDGHQARHSLRPGAVTRYHCQGLDANPLRPAVKGFRGIAPQPRWCGSTAVSDREPGSTVHKGMLT